MAKEVKQEVSVDGTTVTMAYPTIKKDITVDCAEFVPEIQTRLLVHGFKQIAVDSGAGRSAQEAFDLLTRRVEAFREGEWALSGERDTVSEVIEAVCKAFPKYKEDELRNLVEQKPEEVKVWRSNAKVKLELAKARERKAREAAKQADDLEIDLT